MTNYELISGMVGIILIIICLYIIRGIMPYVYNGDEK